MSHYEKLKAMKTGFSDDFRTAIYAQSISNKGYEQYISGTPPLIFSDSVGKPLVNWSITGNTIQSGTPTPDNPVEVKGVGDYDAVTGKYKIPVVSRGKNYLSSLLEIGTLSASEGLPVIMYTRLRTKDFTVLNHGTYTVEAIAHNGEDLYCFVFEYDTETETFIRRIPESWAKTPFTFTIDSQRKIKFLVSKTNGGTDKIYPSEIKFAGITNGDTKTSTIYLSSPLMADDTLYSNGTVLHSDGTAEKVDVPKLPTLKGNCTISVDTEVKPSEMSVTYKSRR